MSESKKETRGRPSIMKGGQRVNVYLNDRSLEIAKRLGNGNVSAGVRLALKSSETTSESNERS